MLKDAYPFLAVLLLGALLTGFLASQFFTGFYILSILCIGLALFVAYFFRNPEREIPADPMLVLSPADGKVSAVRLIDEEDPSAGTFVSIFLNVFDVHVNRTPIAGKVTDIKYKEGAFLNAMNHRSSEDNEQNVVTVDNGRIKITFKQIAGLIARRIVFWPQLGADLKAGERVGLIKFGSRTDLFLPPEVEVLVKKGDRVSGGTSVIGRIKA